MGLKCKIRQVSDQFFFTLMTSFMWDNPRNLKIYILFITLHDRLSLFVISRKTRRNQRLITINVPDFE